MADADGRARWRAGVAGAARLHRALERRIERHFPRFSVDVPAGRRLRAQLASLREELRCQEAQTRSMFETYARYLRGEASTAEMREANAAFVSLVKALGFGALLVLPFAPLSLPLAVKLARRFGIELVPECFRQEAGEEARTDTGPEAPARR